jgi:hypothetical protein
MANNNATPLSAQTITIPAAVLGAPGIYKLQLAGQVLVCRASTAPVLAKFDGGSLFPIEAGFVIPGPDGGFKSVVIQNNSASPVVMTLYAGELGINVIPNNYSKLFPTYTKGTDLTGGTQLASGTQAVFNGSDAANGAAGARKDITVQNYDANGNDITVLGDNGVALVVLPAKSPPWIKETAGSITVKNASAGVVTRVIVSETFYAA